MARRAAATSGSARSHRNLAEAREKARDCRKHLVEELDPHRREKGAQDRRPA